MTLYFTFSEQPNADTITFKDLLNFASSYYNEIETFSVDNSLLSLMLRLVTEKLFYVIIFDSQIANSRKISNYFRLIFQLDKKLNRFFLT